MSRFFKSWKTTLAGLVCLASYVLPLIGIPIPPGTVEGVMTVAVGAGLIAAKDGNVHGGTVDNGTRPTDKGAI